MSKIKSKKNNYNKLSQNIREIIAEEIYKNYCNTRVPNNHSEELAAAEWDELRQDFKESNLQQADDILEKLRRFGYKVRKTKNLPISPIVFTIEEIEMMAEMEHKRWVKERLAKGWKYGEIKDTDNKISPYLIPWSDLSDEIKELDRNPVRKIPEFLARVNLEVFKD